jgi:multisubunit Na+/H+ antiporter MnhG subunit
MVHGEHNRSRNNGGFALIILGALSLFLAPNIYPEMQDLGTMSLVGGVIIGSIGFYLKFFRDRVKQK